MEASAILKATVGTRDHAAIVLGITVGMRIGEILGLAWESVDLKGHRLRVGQQAAETNGVVYLKKPKTKSSVRTIELPAIAVRALESHRILMSREGHSSHALAFPSPEGHVQRRTNFVRRSWHPVLTKLSLKQRGFHHTRHTYATLALGAGVPLPVVSKVLGHKKPSTTLDIYGHVLKSQQSAATQAMNQLFK